MSLLHRLYIEQAKRALAEPEPLIRITPKDADNPSHHLAAHVAEQVLDRLIRDALQHDVDEATA